MIFFRINKGEDIIFSNLNKASLEAPYKSINRLDGDLSIDLIATGQEDSKILGSSRHIKTAISMCSNLATAIEEIKSEQNNNYVILSHNLITTHSKLQDTVENLIPEDSLAGASTHEEQLSIVESLLSTDLSSASNIILNITKRVVDLQAQIEGFKILSGSRKLDIGDHNILKILQNVIHPFYADLLGNSVSIKWHIDMDTAEANKIRTDYKKFNVILHHLLTNAVKYTKPCSCIDINFNHESQELMFSMKSIRIERDELSKIFDLGYCGANVPKSMAGEGVGMYMVKKTSDLLGIEISILPDYSSHLEPVNGVRYLPNKFVLKNLSLASKVGPSRSL